MRNFAFALNLFKRLIFKVESRVKSMLPLRKIPNSKATTMPSLDFTLKAKDSTKATQQAESQSLTSGNFQIRTTKFPYVFWSFNKAFACNLTSDNGLKSGKYTNLNAGTEYLFNAIPRWQFLSLKYLPILLIFALTFTRYDFVLSKERALCYLLALLFVVSVNLLEHLMRKIVLSGILILGVVFAFLQQDFLLLAYALKYFLLFSVMILFYLDLHFRAFELTKNGKVLAHFCLKESK